MHPPPQGHYDTDPVTVENKRQAEEAALEGAKAIRDGEIAAIKSAKEANDNLKKPKEETKEGKKAEKEAKEQEKKDMEKKETEDKKVETNPPPPDEKKALLQIHGWEQEESDSDSDDE